MQAGFYGLLNSETMCWGAIQLSQAIETHRSRRVDKLSALHSMRFSLTMFDKEEYSHWLTSSIEYKLRGWRHESVSAQRSGSSCKPCSKVRRRTQKDCEVVESCDFTDVANEDRGHLELRTICSGNGLSLDRLLV